MNKCGEQWMDKVIEGEYGVFFPQKTNEGINEVV